VHGGCSPSRQRRERNAGNEGGHGGHPDEAAPIGPEPALGFALAGDERLVVPAGPAVPVGVEPVVVPPDRELACEHGEACGYNPARVPACAGGQRGRHHRDRDRRFRVARP
jgi:hypothetical protein